jgi:hypothetical protein
MARKLSLFFTALAIAAFAAPALASAAPEITVNGTRAPIGTTLNGKSTNTTWKTELGNFTCGTVSFVSQVTANTGTTMAAKGTSPMTTSSCFFKGTTAFTIDDATLLSLHSATSGKGTVSLTYTATAFGLTCHYSNTALPFTYPVLGNTVTIAGELTASPAECGNTSIESTFMLTSPSGTVVLH